MKKNTSTPSSTPLHYVVWRALPGGAESYVTQYAEQFGAARDIYVYSLRASENRISEAPQVHFTAGSDNNWACYRDFFLYCRQHKDHFFHLMSTGPITLLLALLAGVRHPVYHIHGTKYWKSAKEKIYLKAAWRLASRFQVTYIANSRYSAGIFQIEVLPLAPKVIYNGFDTENFLARRYRRTSLRRMAYVGRLHTGKNVDLVLRLFAGIAESFPELELHIAGDGMLRETLEAQAQQTPFGHRIVFHGWVEDVASFYQNIDLFLFLSAYESFGNVVLEALLAGVPVLTSNIPVFEEIHGGEEAFLLGDPGDFEAMQVRFEQAVAHFPALAEKAYHFADQAGDAFSMSTHLAEIESLYRQKGLASGSPGPFNETNV